MKKIKRINGPYVHGDSAQKGLQGRAYFNIHYEDGTRTTKLRSRMMMEEHLGRTLRTDEHVDHKNGDHTDDRLENLQVLSDSDHAFKTLYKGGEEMVDITCALCGEVATKRARDVRANRKKGCKGPYCGRSCAGKASHMAR